MILSKRPFLHYAEEVVCTFLKKLTLIQMIFDLPSQTSRDGAASPMIDILR
jgi:hypothetical protein